MDGCTTSKRKVNRRLILEPQEGLDVPREQVVNRGEITGGVSLKRRRLEVKERSQQIPRLAPLRASSRSIKELILVLGNRRSGAADERGHKVHMEQSLGASSEEPRSHFLQQILAQGGYFDTPLP